MTIYPGRPLRGRLQVPGDKSISHRVLIMGALAKGVTEVHGLLEAADVFSTLSCLESLGIVIRRRPDAVYLIEGNGLRGLKEADDVLNAGNSGTTARLLSGVLAGQDFFSVITGDESLRRRPMGRITKPLSLMGARVWGRRGSSLLPLAILGHRLQAIEYTLPVASAQVKSALIFAGLLADGTTIIREPVKSRDHTERMLSLFGASIRVEGLDIAVDGGHELLGQQINVPGDISAAAFWVVAATVIPGSELIIEGVGLNPTRTGILEVLTEMGADIQVEKVQQRGEPFGNILVRYSPIHGTRVPASVIPRLIDEVPVLAVAAALAEGDTIIEGAAELRVKESDRLSGVAAGLRLFGVKVEELPAGLIIHGQPELQGTRVASEGDHRLAMAFAVAGMVAKGKTEIEGSESVSISYPTFWEDLQRLQG